MDEHDNKTGSQKQGGWTPGPWSVCDPDIAVSPFIVVDEANMSVADCACFSSRRGANACLIAAAPDLYEALEALRLQALQSPDLVKTQWGQEALALASAALSRANPSTDHTGAAR